MLAKSKLDSNETLLSQALTNMEISHEEFNAIVRQKKLYERIKENVRNVSEKQENTRLNSVYFCIYEMYLVAAEGYKNAGTDFLRTKKKLVKFGQK